MLKPSYTKFVRAAALDTCAGKNNALTISGTDARQIYLEEVSDTNKSSMENLTNRIVLSRTLKKLPDVQLIATKDLFQIVQNDDVETLNSILNLYPDKINACDDYGWSLLMIACQANSIDVVKELLKRGIDTSVRDKAGNSAQSLVINNRNYILADVLVSYKRKMTPDKIKEDNNEVDGAEEYSCDVCDSIFPDKVEHLSSTLHNIYASKGKKIPANYVIPQTNKGYQLMLKVGWDRESGLGKDGTGKMYPIKAVQKKDRKGLGHEKRKHEEQPTEDYTKHKNRRKLAKDYSHNKRFEINFRREFY